MPQPFWLPADTTPHRAITDLTSTSTYLHHHAGGPEASLRVLCRYLKRVSDRSPPTTDQCRYNWDAPRCSTESEAWLHDCWIGTGVGRCMGRRKGRGHKRRYTNPPLRVDPNSRAPAGPGPSPLFPLPGPPPQCNTVWHTHPRQYSRHTVLHLSCTASHSPVHTVARRTAVCCTQHCDWY